MRPHAVGIAATGRPSVEGHGGREVDVAASTPGGATRLAQREGGGTGGVGGGRVERGGNGERRHDRDSFAAACSKIRREGHVGVVRARRRRGVVAQDLVRRDRMIAAKLANLARRGDRKSRGVVLRSWRIGCRVI